MALLLARRVYLAEPIYLKFNSYLPVYRLHLSGAAFAVLVYTPKPAVIGQSRRQELEYESRGRF
ncbi:hypothetical protein GCM10011352_20500 [Marinobacterium zhoushanense]|uniref:Uncharacterized protein n=1 Tax=Marinobacterium zhoushanense TaxID=1679163 RepID=A0ABQ1KFB1_9GAMM|nr:hypothetical protein GCM10011352_20500 [Marinobacterium zhoushanense]